MKKSTYKILAFFALCIVITAIAIILTIQIRERSRIDDAALIQPKSITVGHNIDPKALDRLLRTIKIYYTFWNTGEMKYLDAALGPTFIDHTFPQGFQKGADALTASSKQLRHAIPNLQCSVEELLITDKRVTARLIFQGISTGSFMGRPPTGKLVSFVAIDILRLDNNKIIEAWHLQDNLSLLQQLDIAVVK